MIKGHRVPILGMAYDRSQHLLYTTSYDGLVLQWNIDDGTTKGFGGKGKAGRSPPMPVSADSRHWRMPAHRRCSRPPSPCARRHRRR